MGTFTQIVFVIVGLVSPRARQPKYIEYLLSSNPDQNFDYTNQSPIQRYEDAPHCYHNKKLDQKQS